MNGSMQEIECTTPLVSLSPTTALENSQGQHYDVEVNPNEKLPEIQDQRLALEQEVANLKKKLTHEIKLREALKSGLQRSPGFLPKIPGYVPAETRELLFEVAVLEEEINFLEKHAVYLRQEIHDEDKSELFGSFRLGGEEETVSVSEKSAVLEMETPESGVSVQPLVHISEPVTPTIPVTPSLTPFLTPEWRPSVPSSPTRVHDRNIPLPVPSTFVSPLSMDSSHRNESESVLPQVLNRKRVIRRGSSSSESLPADLTEHYSAIRMPLRKKATHKKTLSLPHDARKADIECSDASFAKSSLMKKEVGRGDVFERLSALKNGGQRRASVIPSPVNSDKPENFAVKKPAHLKGVQSRYLSHRSPPTTLSNENVKTCTKRPTRAKEDRGRSPRLASPQLETKAPSCFGRSSSNRDIQIESSPTSTPSPIFEDKAISSIKRIVSSMSPTGSPQLKFQNGVNSPFTPTSDIGNEDRLVTPFKLPPTGERENLKVLTLSDERRRTHDLVIAKSLPSIKLNKASNQIHSPFRGSVQHRLSGTNNFAENAKLYAQVKVSSTPTSQAYKIKPIQVQKSMPKGVDSVHSTPKSEYTCSTKPRPDRDNDYKDDKVDMACAPISDASWLSEDLAKLLGTVCSKIRRHSPSPDAKVVAKPPVSVLGSSRRTDSFGRSQSFDIRSHEGLQLLEEFCSDDISLSDSHGVHKHRTTNLGPHRHYYKALKLPLEQNLKA